MIYFLMDAEQKLINTFTQKRFAKAAAKRNWPGCEVEEIPAYGSSSLIIWVRYLDKPDELVGYLQEKRTYMED